jgi:hypothetical protein
VAKSIVLDEERLREEVIDMLVRTYAVKYLPVRGYHYTSK